MAMNRIVILRHAKAEKLAQTDHARGLSSRGHKQTHEFKKWLADKTFQIDFAIVSTAKRTQETWQDLHLDCPVIHASDAYNASAEQWVHLISHTDVLGQTLLIVGHNPGLSDLAYALGAAGELSTCGAVVIEVDVSWANFGLVSGEVVQSFTPTQQAN